MTIEEEFKMLSRLELFENLDSTRLKRLLFVSERYQLHTDEFLFRQNDPSDKVFAVLTGEFSVLIDSTRGAVEISTLGTGELIGELGLISGESRSASIQAKTASEVIGIDSETFLSTVTSDPQTALKMMKILTTRIVEQTDKLALLSSK